jgi:hypothetical protein
LNIIGGFAAALLVYAEMNGLSAACIHSIVDSHYISSETLQAYKTFVSDVLQVGDVNLDNVARMPAFKTVLKDVNNRSHNIFN